MITLPHAETLIEHIRAGLDAVGERHNAAGLTTGDWFPEIAGEIAERVKGPDVDCYARGRRRGEPAPGCRGSEWIFDFCALINDPSVKEEDRFMAQAAIVGEVEWDSNGLDYDFEKLMIVDALVCFFVWQASGTNAQAQLDRFTEAAKRRQEYCRQRGIRQPSAFLLSCWVGRKEKFIHQSILG